MEFADIQTFLKYYAKVKQRTLRLFPYIPSDKIEWTYQAGKFTIGDLIRHLATSERYMFAETAQFQPSRYAGCPASLAPGYEATIKLYEDLHQESLAIFSQIEPSDLHKKCMTPGNIEITLWKWLRAMAEHEIHHRGQIYVYLGILGIETPPIYGLSSEEVIKNSQN